jgi:hypothetical protein
VNLEAEEACFRAGAAGFLCVDRVECAAEALDERNRACSRTANPQPSRAQALPGEDGAQGEL